MGNANVASVAYPTRTSSLRQRICTVAVVLPVVIGVVYWGVLPLACLVAGGAVVSLVEFYSALKHGGYHPRFGIGITAALLLCGAALVQGTLPFDVTGAALTGGILLSLTTELPRRNREGSLVGWAVTLASACYIGWLIGHYILLRRIETPLAAGWLSFLHISPGAAWVYLVLLVTWVQDTMAYFVGRTWGRHKMAPYLSPKKSWEGAAGGFGAAALTALLSVPLFGLPISYGGALVLGIAGGIVGPLGDLVESLIKRQMGIKDISNLMPGHGGVFDRLDSMLFTAPVLYYLILLLTAPSQ